jgi:outer membrane protein W
MLIGINLGGSWALHAEDLANEKRRFSFLASADIGLTYDFYIFNWLSVNTGLLFHPQVVAMYKPEYETKAEGELKVTDYMQTPLCLTIPLQFHINIPRVERLYVGAGVNFNIPITSMTKNFERVSGVEMPETKGSFFFSLPVDIGFDLVKPEDKGGGRFFFRVTPTFLKEGFLLPFGVMWQIYNFKIDTK